MKLKSEIAHKRQLVYFTDEETIYCLKNDTKYLGNNSIILDKFTDTEFKFQVYSFANSFLTGIAFKNPIEITFKINLDNLKPTNLTDRLREIDHLIKDISNQFRIFKKTVGLSNIEIINNANLKLKYNSEDLVMEEIKLYNKIIHDEFFDLLKFNTKNEEVFNLNQLQISLDKNKINYSISPVIQYNSGRIILPSFFSYILPRNQFKRFYIFVTLLQYFGKYNEFYYLAMENAFSEV